MNLGDVLWLFFVLSALQPVLAQKMLEARRLRLLNEFERRQLVEWTPRADDFLKHDDENRPYDDVFGAYRDRITARAFFLAWLSRTFTKPNTLF